MDNDQLSGLPPTGAPVFKSRPDVHTSEIIEMAVEHLSTFGKKVAEAYLAENGVPWRTSMRVLSDPGFRRRPKQPFFTGFD